MRTLYKRMFIVFALLLCVSVFGFAQVTILGKTGMTSSALFERDDVAWVSSGFAFVSLDSGAAKQVKANVSIKMYTVPFDSLVFFLEKAYVKFRLPWIDETSLRVSFGKMPISWGKGLYFNAGDLLFGYSPSVLTGGSSDSSDWRAATEWAASLYVPLGDFSYVEAVVFPPLYSGAGLKDDFVWQHFSGAAQDNNGTFAVRAVYAFPMQFLASLEAGYAFSLKKAVVNTAVHAASLNLDGTLFFDYTLSASLEYVNTTLASGLADIPFAVSLSLFKNLTVRLESGDIPFSMRAEAVYLSGSEWETEIFSQLHIAATDVLGVQLSFLAAVNKEQYTFRPALLWSGIQGLQISAEGFISYNGKAAASHELSGGIACSALYRF